MSRSALIGTVLLISLSFSTVGKAESSSASDFEGLTGAGDDPEGDGQGAEAGEGDDDHLLDEVVGVSGEGEDGEDDRPAWAVEGDEGRSGRLARLSPAWFYASLGLTVAVGAGTVVTGVLALRLNDLYLEEQSDWLLRERGMGLQTVTNAFIGVTAALGVATILLGVFTDWSRNGGRASAGSNDDDRAAAPLVIDGTYDLLLARALARRL